MDAELEPGLIDRLALAVAKRLGAKESGIIDGLWSSVEPNI